MVTFDLEPLESHNQHIKYYNNDRCSTNLNIYSTLHLSHICNVTLFVKGLCGLVVRMVDCRSRSLGFESRQVKKILLQLCLSEILS